MRQVFDTKGVAFSLGDKIAAGGQGEVFPIAALPDMVVKIFFPKFLTGDEGKNLLRKFDALRSKKACAALPDVAWPEFRVYDENRQCIGYAMKRVSGSSFSQALALHRLREGNDGIDRLVLSEMAAAFLETLRRLHAEDVYHGDFNCGNFLFDARRSRISFIDTDSYQVAAAGSVYNCRVTTPGMTAPEYLNIHVAEQWRSPASEVFSGAIIVFLILMTGRHPFDARGAENYMEGLAKNMFPYRPHGEASTGLIPAGIWEAVWNDFPLSLQQAFTDIFVRGHGVPGKRCTLETLLVAVMDYRARLLMGKGIVALDARQDPAPSFSAPATGDKEAQATEIDEVSLWQRVKPRSFWGRVLWRLVG